MPTDYNLMDNLHAEKIQLDAYHHSTEMQANKTLGEALGPNILRGLCLRQSKVEWLRVTNFKKQVKKILFKSLSDGHWVVRNTWYISAHLWKKKRLVIETLHKFLLRSSVLLLPPLELHLLSELLRAFTTSAVTADMMSSLVSSRYDMRWSYWHYTSTAFVHISVAHSEKLKTKEGV